MHSSFPPISFYPNGIQQSSFNEQHQQIRSLNNWEEYFLGKHQAFLERAYSNSNNAAFSTPFSHSFNPSFIPPSLTISPQAAMKYENDIVAQHIFFKTLLRSVKQIYKCCSLKNPTWKNPFLYKTALCSHWRFHRSCRFKSECWYAHGMHELRFFPRMADIPSPGYFSKCLAHLDLPKQILDKAILNAYRTAGITLRNGGVSPTSDRENQGPSLWLSDIGRPSKAGLSDSMYFHQKQKSSNALKFQSQWSGSTSDSSFTEEPSSIKSSNNFSLFSNNYPSNFI